MMSLPTFSRPALPGVVRVLAGLGLSLALVAPALAQKVKLATSAGDIIVELEPEKAPKSVANFLQDVKSGFYDGTVFHRVIADFMIQGGGFTDDLSRKPTLAPIALESRNGLSNRRGTVAMARTSVPDSATSQFFINVADNSWLDAANSPDGSGYAVFGRVVAGMDVVDRIRNTPTTTRAGMGDVPVTAVVIKKASLEP